jgi:hypothetical protein
VCGSSQPYPASVPENRLAVKVAKVLVVLEVIAQVKDGLALYDFYRKSPDFDSGTRRRGDSDCDVRMPHWMRHATMPGNDTSA